MEKKAQHFNLQHDKDIVIFKGIGVWKPALSKECIDSINETIFAQNAKELAPRRARQLAPIYVFIKFRLRITRL